MSPVFKQKSNKSEKHSFSSNAHSLSTLELIPTKPAADEERKERKDLQTSSALNSKSRKVKLLVTDEKKFEKVEADDLQVY